MDEKELARRSRNKKIALIFGVIAVVWYVLSMFTIWNL